MAFRLLSFGQNAIIALIQFQLFWIDNSKSRFKEIFMPSIHPDERCIDLHSHTTASDGDHSPERLMAYAFEIGLKAIAVTDHDTTAGVLEATAEAERLGIELIPGIELSAEPNGSGQCHILGLYIDVGNANLQSRLDQVVENRNNRNARIVERMQRELGWEIDLAEVEAEAGGEIVARPHFAKVLVRKKLVPNFQTAFDLYLGTGGKAYISRDRLTPKEAIGLIHGAGGVAILAHPNNLKMNEAETEAEIIRLMDFGLDGIEARYNRHSPAETNRYLTLASRLKLVTAGGSDFHGPTVKKDVQLGHVEGLDAAPYGLLEGLLEVGKKQR